MERQEGSGTPDPGADLSRILAPLPSGAGRRWASYRRRRATILTRTRLLFAEHGYAGVHLRGLAQSCGMAAQTIYNLVGDKEAVVTAALDEYFQAVQRFAEDTSAAYPNYLLAQVDAFGLAVLEHPAVNGQLARCFFSAEPVRHDLYERLARRGVRPELLRMRRNGALRPGIEIDLLADQLATLGAGIVLDKVRGLGGPDRLRHDLAQGWGLMLLSALCGPEQAKVESWLDALLAPTHAATADSLSTPGGGESRGEAGESRCARQDPPHPDPLPPEGRRGNLRRSSIPP
jgi:AcrR family transcriptional regulator